MKEVLARFLRLPLKRKILFAQVSLMLLFVHLALRLFSFARVYRFFKRWRRSQSPQQRARQISPAEAAEAVCWAVTRAGKTWLGDEGCLTQALLGETMLIRLGVPARLCIGIRKAEDGSLLAHAWVEENGGRILIGGKTGLSGFQRFPEIQRVLEQQQERT